MKMTWKTVICLVLIALVAGVSEGQRRRGGGGGGPTGSDSSLAGGDGTVIFRWLVGAIKDGSSDGTANAY